MENFIELKAKLQDAKPLIHCITNVITINDCANIILCLGARPLMIEHPKEVQEVTANAKALLLNIGNLTEAHLESMPLALATANRHHVPVVLDLVGVGCSTVRKELVLDMLKKHHVAVIKGNYSEIKALFCNITTDGVDSRPEDKNITDMVEDVTALAGRYKAVVLASGAVDIMSDGQDVYSAANGDPMMGSITGTGCMLGAVVAAYLAVTEPLSAVVNGTVAMGLAGEKAAKEALGPGSFHAGLFDSIWNLTEADLKLAKVEKIK